MFFLSVSWFNVLMMQMMWPGMMMEAVVEGTGIAEGEWRQFAPEWGCGGVAVVAVGWRGGWRSHGENRDGPSLYHVVVVCVWFGLVRVVRVHLQHIVL